MSKHASTDHLLAILFWNLERLSCPTFRNLTEGFEAWEHRSRLQPVLRRYQRSGRLESDGRGPDRAIRLTEAGRREALGGVDPRGWWERAWDGQWRFLVFDLPAKKHSLRLRLWRWMRSQRFGFLQNSVWITPDPLTQVALPLQHLKLTAESYTTIAGQPGPGRTDADLVAGAWDFRAINQRYARVLETAKAARTASIETWAARLHAAWVEALAADPLLPQALWPRGYLGRSAFEAQAEVWTSCPAGARAVSSR